MELDRYPMLLLEELKTLIHAIVYISANHLNKAPLTDVHPYANNLCYTLEKILSHGLRRTVTSFWKFTRHLDCCLPGTNTIIAPIRKTYKSMVSSASPTVRGLARGRLFVRVALNESAVGDYLAGLLFHPKILNDHYDKYALLKNDEHVSILLLLLDTLKTVHFALCVDSTKLKLDDPHYWYKMRRSNLVLSDEVVASFRHRPPTHFIVNTDNPYMEAPTPTENDKHDPMKRLLSHSSPNVFIEQGAAPLNALNSPTRGRSSSFSSSPPPPTADTLPKVQSFAGISHSVSSPPVKQERGFFSFFSSKPSPAPPSTPTTLSTPFNSNLIDFDTCAANRDSILQFTQKLRELVRKGIPDRIRAKCWISFIRSSSAATPRPANQNFAGAVPTLSEWKTLLSQEISFGQKILQDLDRTFKSNTTSFDSEKRMRLFNVLKGFCLSHPDLGYVQGMSYIAGILIHVTNEETESYAILDHLIHKYSIFSDDMVGLRKCVYQLDRLIERHLPKLFSHFKEQGVTPLLFASEWFSTLFAYRVSISACCRLWDILLVEDQYYFFKFCIAILDLTQDEVVDLPFEKIIKFLKDEVEHIKIENIIDAAESIPITAEDVDQLEKEFMNPNTDQYSCFALEY